jgi:hypothetical protein
MTRESTEQPRPAASTATTDRHGAITTTFRHLRILGFDECEAGNLTAYVSGIAIGPRPWTVRELTRLHFLREMYRVGRLVGADDRRCHEGSIAERSLDPLVRRAHADLLARPGATWGLPLPIPMRPAIAIEKEGAPPPTMSRRLNQSIQLSPAAD